MLSKRAFTLLEVLLVLALIGLLAGVLVTGGARLLSSEPQTPEEVFWAAVQEARTAALKTETEVALEFSSDQERGKAFMLLTPSGPKSFPVPAAGDLEVTFLSAAKGGNLVMVGGTVLETSEVKTVSFYPDGTCSPFRVQFFGRGETRTIGIDPWTCAPVLRTAEEKARR